MVHNQDLIFWTSLILAASVLVVITGGLYSRIISNKGIGWQFIRYTVICISLPLAAILAISGTLTGEASTILAAAMGYSFGKSSEKSNDI